VDRLTKAYKDLEFAQSDTAKRIADLKQIQKEQNMMNKLTAESNRAVEGSYNALSAQYRLNKMYINNLTKAERENDPAAKKLIENGTHKFILGHISPHNNTEEIALEYFVEALSSWGLTQGVDYEVQTASRLGPVKGYDL
jgi:hypothetical protein